MTHAALTLVALLAHGQERDVQRKALVGKEPPELVFEAGHWINGPPITLGKLKGQFARSSGSSSTSERIATRSEPTWSGGKPSTGAAGWLVEVYEAMGNSVEADTWRTGWDIYRRTTAPPLRLIR